MSEIVRREPDSLPEKMEWARAMATASLLPRQYQQNPGNLLFAVEYADALGVSRINAITSIHVIEGKPSASADLIASLIRKAGHRLRVTGDDKHAVAQLIRADDPDFTFESRWDLDKARAAGLLGKGVWKSYPGAMLRSRAITEVARMGASDALFGVIYTPEELGAEVDADGEVVQSVTQVQSSSSGQERMRAMVGGSQNAGAAEGSQEETPVAGGRDGSIPSGHPSAAPVAPQADKPADDVPLMTDAQSRKMGAAMRERGLGERDQALAFTAQVIGRQVGSRKELTKFEAARVIDALEKMAVPEPEVVEAEIVEEPSAQQPPAQAAVPSTSEPDADAVWAQIVEVAKAKSMTPADVEDDFFTVIGVSAREASGAELASYLHTLTTGQVA